MRIASMVLSLGSLLFVACSDDASSSGTTGTGQGGATTSTSTAAGQTSANASGATTGVGGSTAFALTSSGFVEGAAIPAKYACPSDVSPDLTWTAAPLGTKGYAIVLTDKSNSLLHWGIWDIPGTATTLPEGVQKVAAPAVPSGAKQAKSFDNATFGYRGPCPPNKHTYRFVVYALDAAPLSNLTTSSSLAQVEAEVKNHSLGSASLSGTFTP